MTIAWPKIIDVSWRYGITAALLLYVVYRVTTCLLMADAPTLQVPPPGYEVNETRVLLSWVPGEGKRSFSVQVFEGEDLTKEPIFSRITRGTRINVPDLKEGRQYCWRVLDEENAALSCFRTAKHLVPY